MRKETLPESWPAWIKEKRARAGYPSLQAMEDATGISRSAISNWSHPEHPRSIDDQNLETVSRALSRNGQIVTVNDLRRGMGRMAIDERAAPAGEPETPIGLAASIDQVLRAANVTATHQLARLTETLLLLWRDMPATARLALATAGDPAAGTDQPHLVRAGDLVIVVPFVTGEALLPDTQIAVIDGQTAFVWLVSTLLDRRQPPAGEGTAFPVVGTDRTVVLPPRMSGRVARSWRLLDMLTERTDTGDGGALLAAQ